VGGRRFFVQGVLNKALIQTSRRGVTSLKKTRVSRFNYGIQRKKKNQGERDEIIETPNSG